jgi:DNA-binding MarR family transcriptional regulator
MLERMIDRAGRDANLRQGLGRRKMARSTSDSHGSEQYKLATSPSHLLHRAEQLASVRFAQLVGDSITLRQFTVLAAIAERPGVSQSELVRSTGIDRSTLADLMARMEKRGWIVRTPSRADKRAYSVLLGQAGGTVFAATAHHARAADAAILDLLPRTKARTFLATLTKLAKLAEAAAERAEREHRKRTKRKGRERAGAKPGAMRKQRT